MAFRVGQKVVRIEVDAETKRRLKGCWRHQDSTRAHLTVVGQVYTIQTINEWQDCTLLTFDELDNGHLRNGSKFEPGFDAIGFRPVVERKTDISIFTAMLTPSRRQTVTAGETA